MYVRERERGGRERKREGREKERERERERERKGERERIYVYVCVCVRVVYVYEHQEWERRWHLRWGGGGHMLPYLFIRSLASSEMGTTIGNNRFCLQLMIFSRTSVVVLPRNGV